MTFCCRSTIVLLFIACHAGATAADERTQFSERLPAQTSFAIFSRDVGASCTAFQHTDIGEVLCGSESAPLRAELASRDMASPQYMRPSFGFDWSDLVDVHDPGGMAIFRSPDGTTGVAWIFVPAKPSDASPNCIAAANHYFTQAQYKRENAERKDAKLVIYRRSQGATAGASPVVSTAVLFQTAGYYGVANSLAAAEAIIGGTKASSAQPSDASDGVRATWLRDDSASPADISLFIDPFALWELLSPTPEKLATPAGGKNVSKSATVESPAAAAERLGYAAVKSIAAVVRFAPDKTCQWSVEAALDVKEPYRGALRVLELRVGHLAAWPEWIGTDFDAAARWGWDVPLAMRGLGTMYDESTEPGPDGVGLFEDLLDGLRDEPEGVQVDLRRDLFEQLAPAMLSVSYPSGAPDDDNRSVFVAAVRDVQKVQATLTRFFKDDKRVHFQNAGGFSIWTVDKRNSLFVESENDTSVTVRGLALGPDRLVVVPQAELVERATSAAARPKLASDAGWAELVGWIDSLRSDHTAYESLLRLDRTIGPSYTAAITPLKSDEKRTAAQAGKTSTTTNEWAESRSLLPWLWRLMLFGTDSARAQPLCAVAPKFDALRTALPQTGVAIVRSEKGWVIHCGVLRAEKKKMP